MVPRYLEFERFIFDRHRSTLTHAGKPIALTPKTLELLGHLLQRAGQTVTKSELLDALWTVEDVGEATLSQHVYLLRKGLGEHGAHDLIHTVPRRGYRFVGDVREHEALPSPPARSRGQTAYHSLAAVLVAAFLIAALLFTPGPVRKPRPAPPLDDVSARTYLLARFYWQKRDEASLRRSVALFSDVVRRVPSSALGYSGLADAHFELGLMAGPRQRAAEYRLADEYATESVRRDPTSSEAHTSYACALEVNSSDVDGVRAEYQRAIALNPRYPSAHHFYGIFELYWRNFAVAERELETATSLDPTSVPSARWLGFAYYYDHRYRDAIAQLHQALELDPNNGAALLYLGLSLVFTGRTNDAVATLQRLPLGSPRHEVGKDEFTAAEIGTWVAYAHAVGGMRTIAERELASVARSKTRANVAPQSLAAVYLALGRRREALALIQSGPPRAYDAASFVPRGDPRLGSLATRERI